MTANRQKEDLSLPPPLFLMVLSTEGEAYLDAQLKIHKQESFKGRLPDETQFLSLARENPGLKRQLLPEMDAADKQNTTNFFSVVPNPRATTPSHERDFCMISGGLAAPYCQRNTASPHLPAQYS